MMPLTLTQSLTLRQHSVNISLFSFSFLAEVFKSVYLLSICSKYQVGPTLEVVGMCYLSSAFGED